MVNIKRLMDPQDVFMQKQFGEIIDDVDLIDVTIKENSTGIDCKDE